MITNMNCSDTLQSAAEFSVCLGSETPQKVKAPVSKPGNLFDPQDVRIDWPPHVHHGAQIAIQIYKHK